jgi:enoyl-CoA hydratase
MTTLETDQAGRVLTVRMSNPPRNFMTGGMVAELEEMVRRADEDRSIGAVVLTGAVEGAFITHYDVAEILAGSEAVGAQVSPAVAGGALRATGALGRIPGAADALRRTPAVGLVELRRIHDVFRQMNRSDVVFVAAINGLAMGGGCELALACDVRIMAARDDARIGLPEITLGLIPGGGGTQRLARMLGTSRALEMMLEGRVLAPHEAEELGRVHRVVAPEALAGEAAATAERLGRRAPGTVAALKRAVSDSATRSLADGMHMERAAFLSVTARPAAVRAMRAYVEEVEGLDDAVPFAVEELMGRWQEGTAVDLTAE